MKNLKSAKLGHYYYDKEADVFYMSKGKPSAKDASREMEEDMIVRYDPDTNIVTGVAILNFSKRASKKAGDVKLPFEIELHPAI